MNDRFKFRVWDIEEWTYLKCKYSKSAGYHKYTFGKHDVWHDIGYFIENNPKYYIVEQCTGLKDKNGNLIYEGDIVKIGNGSINGEVWEDNITVEWIADKGRYNLPLWTSEVPDWSHYVEIIGNVHTDQKEEQ